ncbi:thermonuclease family protein [Roseomonas sp. PWR1]|uniref:Thermonuclease family protein n=1 Tax=Roseomonas nitratireducens TaxID=2820810 RepID=A0ABS4AWP5_9PROT|nr:thermonuclease family protein [Neoroseomonas nitratireducens]MBP0465785.1 thermonuclease family protein [Neoroseomonas nitratireducens]
MWFRRSRLPPDLRDALRAAERAARPPLHRRVAARLRAVGRMPLLAWIVLAGLLGFAGWKAGLVGDGASVAGPSTPRPVARITVRASAVDGDTLAAGADRLRINGIDAPEMAQSCERAGAAYPCGRLARDAMASILGRGMVDCEILGADQYGRRIARCRNEAGQDIAAELVRQGWAIAFRRFSLDYVGQEDEARRARRGIWDGRFEEPDAYRARIRSGAAH